MSDTVYVCQTPRGLLRTVRGSTVQDAWQSAKVHYRATTLHNLRGEAWVAAANGNPARETGADVPAGHARALYLQACAAELSPAAREHLRAREETSDHCHWLASERRALCLRGLIAHTGIRAPLTDLGRSFVAHMKETP